MLDDVSAYSNKVRGSPRKNIIILI
jgi:hypothetical protein